MIRHTVRPGETSSSVARAYGVTLDALLDANPQLVKVTYRDGRRDFAPEHFRVMGIINVPTGSLSGPGALDAPRGGGRRGHGGHAGGWRPRGGGYRNWSTSYWPVPYYVPYYVETAPLPVPQQDLSWDWIDPSTGQSLFNQWAQSIWAAIVQRPHLAGALGALQRAAANRDILADLFGSTLWSYLTGRWATPSAMVAELGGTDASGAVRPVVTTNAALGYQEWLLGRMLLGAAQRSVALSTGSLPPALRGVFTTGR